MKTLLVKPEELENEFLEVVGDAYRHLFRASRMAVGDALRLVDGEGHARQAEVKEVSRRHATVVLGAELPDGEPQRKVEAWVPMPRSSRATWMVEKLTEVGVGAIRFYRSDRAPRQSGAQQIERFRRVAAGALEQSGRSRLPDLAGDLEWDQLLDALSEAQFSLVLDPEGEGSAPQISAAVGRVVVVTGPEGGWSPEESAALRAVANGWWRLGPTVMRVETAAIVGVARVVAMGED